MTLSRVCQFGCTSIAANLLRSPITTKPLIPRVQTIRLLANDSRNSFTRSTRSKESFMEGLMAPSTGAAYRVGSVITLGCATVGLGALCYYGLGLSSTQGAVDRMYFWPQYVRDRIKTTYTYLGASVVITAATAAMCLRSPFIMRLTTIGTWYSFIFWTTAVLSSGMVVHKIPYQEGFGLKQVAWLATLGILGTCIAPLSYYGGAALIRAAWYTAGITGGLSAVAICAPSEKFLTMSGPLAIGCGVMIASTLGVYFLPPSTALGSALYATYYYGGLVLFSLLLLYDTQKIMKQAELIPPAGYRHGDCVMIYDPINNSLSVLLDILNIFGRLVHGNRG